jgi:hypothetical protein
VDEDEAESHLAVIRARIEAGVTGARWQRRAFESARVQSADDLEAAAKMLAEYRRLSASDVPVHRWPMPTLDGT